MQELVSQLAVENDNCYNNYDVIVENCVGCDNLAFLEGVLSISTLKIVSHNFTFSNTEKYLERSTLQFLNNITTCVICFNFMRKKWLIRKQRFKAPITYL